MRRLLALAVLVASLGFVAVGCGDHSGDSNAGAGSDHGHTGTDAPSADIVTLSQEPDEDGFAGTAVTEPQAAPDFGGLRNSLGRPVSMADLRGKAVLVTFVYSSCPDVCPLIMSSIRRALETLGDRADSVRVVAVSVDPEGDTPAAVNRFLRQMRVGERVDWLVGSRADLKTVWNAWGIATRIPRDQPELVEHSAPIFGVSASGRIEVIYGPQVKAAELVQDIPKLQAL